MQNSGFQVVNEGTDMASIVLLLIKFPHLEVIPVITGYTDALSASALRFTLVVAVASPWERYTPHE